VYWTGDDLGSLTGAANIADKTAARSTPWQTEPDFEDGHVVHAPVDALRANGFGLHHVHGNVWEWCLDGFYGYDAWRSVRPGDGLRGPVVGARSRVLRGGSFYDFAAYARSAFRSMYDPGSRDSYLGFRPAQGMEKWSTLPPFRKSLFFLEEPSLAFGWPPLWEASSGLEDLDEVSDVRRIEFVLEDSPGCELRHLEVIDRASTDQRVESVATDAQVLARLLSGEVIGAPAGLRRGGNAGITP
jgi:hypothetical protein